MADPFSIIALTGACYAGAQSLQQLISSVRSAPDELLALSNEICNLKFVLDEVKVAVLESKDLSSKELSALCVILIQARAKYNELDALMAKWGKLGPWGDSWHMGRLDRFLWLRDKKKVCDLQREMREIRTNLLVVLGTRTLTATTRLAIDVQAMHTESIRMFVSATSEERATQASSRQITSHEEMRSGGPCEDAQSPKTKLRSNEQTSQQSDHLTATLPASAPSDSLLESTPGPEIGVNYSSPSSMSRDSLLVLPVSYVPNKHRMCGSDCRCLCHKQQNIKTPQLLNHLVGNLFLGYAGAPAMQQQCSISTCLQREALSFQLTYYFPSWFTRQAISISMTRTSLGTPSMNLKVRRSVTETSNLFTLSRRGNVEGIRALFDQRLASPDDVIPWGGWSPLHFAVDHSRLDVCKLLLENGADPGWEDATGTTPVEIAWRNILHLRVPPQVAEAFAVLFPRTEFVQDRHFTQMHKIVIGLEAGDLKEEVVSSPASIHLRDLDGWTPVHWAARRGNHAALDILLDSGGDPLLVTKNESRNALHLAAQGNSYACIQTLLKYRRGNTMLDIDAVDGYGVSALGNAANYNCPAVAACLMKSGADINQVDNNGETPLFHAVYTDAYECIPLLLNADATYLGTTKARNTVLHIAAAESDLTMVALLTKAKLRGIDTAAKNSEGLTALEVCDARSEAPVGFKEAFERLLSSVHTPDWDTQSVGVASSEGESWKSLEDVAWDEAERGEAEDRRDAEAHAALFMPRGAGSPKWVPEDIEPTSILVDTDVMDGYYLKSKNVEQELVSLTI